MNNAGNSADSTSASATEGGRPHASSENFLRREGGRGAAAAAEGDGSRRNPDPARDEHKEGPSKRPPKKGEHKLRAHLRRLKVCIDGRTSFIKRRREEGRAIVARDDAEARATKRPKFSINYGQRRKRLSWASSGTSYDRSAQAETIPIRVCRKGQAPTPWSCFKLFDRATISVITFRDRAHYDEKARGPHPAGCPAFIIPPPPSAP
jgi:hypothetical protein